MKLYAVSDLHLANRVNREALEALPEHLQDWLILAGDIGESEDQLRFALQILTKRFKKVIWTPGNHDLWSLPSDTTFSRGETKYKRLVALCREFGVLTPEDPFARWPGENGDYIIAPMLLLYDFSFRPDYIKADEAVDWAAESGVVCTDVELLHPDPYISIPAWCAYRSAYTERRLEALPGDARLVLVNHFPLRRDLVYLRIFRRFSIWCGTRRTEDWHTRFPVSVVVYGHLHVRGTHYRDGVRFEEVSFGYPRDWREELGLEYYLREILPGK